MKTYTAVANGTEIIDVIAKDEADAKVKIEKALSRPGRRDEFNKWVDGGKKVK